MAGETQIPQGGKPADGAGGAAAPAAGTQPAAGAAADPKAPMLGGAADAANPSGEQGADGKPKDVQPAALELKMPEGWDAKSEGVQAFTKLAQESGLKADQAQKIFDLHAQALTKAQEPLIAAAQEELKKVQAEKQAQRSEAWRAEIQKDPQLGGAKFPETVRLANQALAKYGGPEAVKALQALQLTDCAPLVRLLANVGRAMGEASTAGAPAAGAAGDSKAITTIEQAGKALYTKQA